MAKKKKLCDKVDKRTRTRAWCGEYQENNPNRKKYRYISYNRTQEDLERQTQLAREKWGTGVFAHLRKNPTVPDIVLPVVDGQPVITIDNQGRKNTTFGEFAWRWYNDQVGKTGISESSKSGYRAWISSHLVPTFGSRIIRDITISELQNFLYEFQEQSESKVTKVRMTIQKIFKFAEINKLVDHEILGQLATLKLPSTKKGKRRALTEAEQRVMRFLGKTHTDGLLLMILYWLGSRRGEALALRWSDFDFEDGTVHIQRDVDFKAETTEKLGELKTDAAYRFVPVVQELIDVLEAFKPEASIISKEIRNNTDFLFKGKRNGKPLSESSFKRIWEQLMIAAYEIDHTIEAEQIKTGNNRGKWRSILTPHYFRHNFATMLCDWGVTESEAIAYMGHEDSEMIREVYAHRTKKAQAKNAALFRQGASEHIEYLNGTKEKPHF